MKSILGKYARRGVSCTRCDDKDRFVRESSNKCKKYATNKT